MELKKRKIDSVETALKEMKLLKLFEEEEEDRKSQNFALQEEVQYQQMDNKRTQNQVRNTGPVPGRREIVCWACGKKGHVMRNCHAWAEFKKKGNAAPANATTSTETQLNSTGDH